MAEPPQELRTVKPSRDLISGSCCLAVFTVLVVSFLFFRGLADVKELQQLLTGGKQTVGTITGKYQTHGKGASNVIDYKYKVDSNTYDGSAQVGLSEYDETQEGQTTAVTYLPSDPTLHRYGVVDQARVDDGVNRWRNVTATFAALLVFPNILLWLMYRAQKRFLQTANTVEAAIDSKEFIGGRSPQYKVGYSFTEEGGFKVKREVNINSGRMKELDSGKTVAYYDPSDLSKSRIPQEFNLAKLA